MFPRFFICKNQRTENTDPFFVSILFRPPRPENGHFFLFPVGTTIVSSLKRWRE
jgi:hypothetical protein